MYTIQIIDQETGKSAICEIPHEHGPSLRSTLLDHRNELGERNAGAHVYDKEDALTRAYCAFAQLCATVNCVIEKEDPNYE